MKLQDLTGESLRLIQGVEEKLRRRQRRARISAAAGLGGIVLHVVLAALDGGTDDLRRIGLFVQRLVTLDFGMLSADGVTIPELAGFLVVVGGLGGYALLRWTSLLMHESREPFRYTFSINPFAVIADTPGDRFKLESADRFSLLHHDLMERLNGRIRRLSILDTGPVAEGEAGEALASHIHIEGHFTVRERTPGVWVVQVMPRIRIGASTRPATLAHPVRFELAGAKDSFELTADAYNQIVERVYSRVATEIYRQIEADVRDKMSLFPTHYLRAVALFHEAEDFARSNTIDAYDRAIGLYRESLRYFSIADVRPLTRLLLRLPVIWRHEAGFVHRQAMVRTGYAKCLIYRRLVSTYTGRARNPLFEIPPLLEDVIGDLRYLHARITGYQPDRTGAASAYFAFPRDTWHRYMRFRPGDHLFAMQRGVLFEAYVVCALANYYLEAPSHAADLLQNARATDPDRPDRDPLYLLAAAEIEPDVGRELLLFQRAAELAPDFQLARYLLAYAAESRFRMQNELTRARAQRVIQLYEDVVLDINPGNIAAIAAQGQLQWLLGESAAALRKFEQGLELKTIVQETFIGELSYGVARIAAERGSCDACYAAYTTTVAADPGVAAYSSSSDISIAATRASLYEYITPSVLARFEQYRDRALQQLAAMKPGDDGHFLDADGRLCSQRTIDGVRSFVLNDYGNACFNYYYRCGDARRLDAAVEAYTLAVESDPGNAVAFFNLANALSWTDDRSLEMPKYLRSAEALAPSWPAVLTSLAHAVLNEIRTEVVRLEEDRRAAEASLRAADRERTARATAREIRDDDSEREARQQRPDVDVDAPTRRLEQVTAQIAAQWARVPGEVLPRVETALARTRLFAWFAGPDVELTYDGGGVDPILERMEDIELARLEENDVTTLRLWAEVLSTNTDSPAALDAARRLGEFLLQFQREHFHQDRFLHAVYEATGDEIGVATTRARMTRQLRDWLAKDPMHWATLNWSVWEPGPVFADPAAQGDADDGDRAEYHARVQLVERGIEVCTSLDCDPVALHRVIGEYALNRAGGEEERLATAVHHFAAAASLAPTAANMFRLGQAHEAAGDLDQAATQFRAAIRKERGNADYHARLGAVLQEQGDRTRAAESYRRALRLAPDNEGHRTSLKLVLNDSANALYTQDRYAEAATLYREALDVAPDDAVIWSNLSNACREMREPGRRAASLEQAVAALDRAVEVATAAGDGAAAEYAWRRNGLQRQLDFARAWHEDSIDRVPAPTPIIIEVAEDLLQFVRDPADDSLIPEIKAAIERMRSGILEEYGVAVPALRFRDGSHLAGGWAVITLHEATQAARTISLEGDGAGALIDAVGDVVRANLADFFGTQQAFDALAVVPDAAAMLRADTPRLAAIARAMRGLLREGAPVVEVHAIWEHCRDLPLDEITAESLRGLPAIIESLPGRGAGHVKRTLPPVLEQRIAGALVHRGAPLLALSLTDHEALVDEIGSIAAAGNGPAAVVVNDAALRTVVRTLAERKDPGLPVLGSGELEAEPVT